MRTYQFAMISGGMTATATLDGLRTPATIVQEIKEHLGLCTRTFKGQAAIDRDAATVIGVPAKVRPARDE
jgi:hypothetical protein